MKLRIVLLGFAAFLLALVVVLPVRWISPLLPGQIHCNDWRGSVWRGRCTGMSIGLPGAAPLQVESLRWKIHPLRLLRLALRADFTATYAQGEADGVLDAGTGGRIAVTDLSARALLDRRMVGALPAGWTGQLEIDQLALTMQDRQLLALQGTVQVRDLGDGRGRTFGSYRLEFPAGATAPFTGALRDTGGQLEVLATLQIGADRSWTLDGTAAMRPGADPALARQLDMLDAPDAAGRHRLSAAGSFD